MRKKARLRKEFSFIAKELSEEDINITLSQIGILLKFIRRQIFINQANQSHYEQGINMRLSTLLRLLHRYGVSFEDFFAELRMMRLPAYDNASGQYRTEHAGISYYLPFELLNSLKAYYSARHGTVAEWYRDLPGVDRAKIKRDPEPSAANDFYPDPEF